MRRLAASIGTAILMATMVACGAQNASLGTGASVVAITNELGSPITALEIQADASTGFVEVLPTDDVASLEAGETVDVHYDLGTPAEADIEGLYTMEDVTVQPGEDDSYTTTVAEKDEPIEGFAIRATAGGETYLFNGVDLENLKSLSLHVDGDVAYVTFVTTDGEEGSTQDAAVERLEAMDASRAAAEDAAKKAYEQEAAERAKAEADRAAAAVAETATAEVATSQDSGDSYDGGGYDVDYGADSQGGAEQSGGACLDGAILNE